MSRIAIISNEEEKGKIYEDLELKNNLIRKNVQCEIVNWIDKTIDWNIYDLIFFSSNWGYQKNLFEFENWLNDVDKKTKLINSKDIIEWNTDKSNQFNLNLPFIESLCIKNIDNFSIEKIPFNTFVLKPLASADGENTYLFNKENLNFNLNNQKDIREINYFVNKIFSMSSSKGIVIQKFEDDIKYGELAFIYLSGKLSHVLRRFPGIFEKYKEAEVVPIDKVNKKALKLSQKCIDVLNKEVGKINYARIDIIKKDNDYNIMELELVEPYLYIEELDNSKRKEVIENISKMLISNL